MPCEWCRYVQEHVKVKTEPPYQDFWVKGRVLEHGVRECEHRYVPIKGLVLRLGGKCRVLDFGAGSGYFSVRLASDFPDCKVVAVDDDVNLKKVVKMNGVSNVEVINSRLNSEEIIGLGKFDVVIAYSVVHHTENPLPTLFSLMYISEHFLIETPYPDEHRHTHNKDNAVEVYNLIHKFSPRLMCLTPPRRKSSPIDFSGAKLRPIFLISLKELPPPKPIKLTYAEGGKHAQSTAKLWLVNRWLIFPYVPFRGSFNLYGEEAPVICTWNEPLRLLTDDLEGTTFHYEWSLAWKVRLEKDGEDVEAYATGLKVNQAEILWKRSLRNHYNVQVGDVFTVSPA